ncbi:hypothetical protein QWJ34_08765 [Saccharibacillus sp. CPCC 101409]|uniref:hypothetical protein n=1 Tax=Saccharibacillus sp. CPCC 101409 TaxID=3058041 RepID=UPI002671C559|nr:hypothetical protein [Saccharibacillus sp. CPCC 101409]MDO3409851.1 hypothetical protein [Saccharibacillus sp. CPCC 101409]
MTTATWISTLAIFALLTWTTFGRKVFNPIRLILPIGVMSYFGATYLRDIPSGGSNGWVLAASAAFGALIGALLLLMSHVEYDNKTRRTYITTGIASVGVLSIMFILRIGLVQWVTSHGRTAYEYSQLHHFDLYIIGPAFIFMAGSMLLVRIVGLLVRARRIRSEAVSGLSA